MMRTCYQVVLLRRQVRKPALSWDHVLGRVLSESVL